MGDLDTSFMQLQSFDVDELDDLEATQSKWIEEAKAKLKCDEDNLKAHLFSGLTKPVLCRWLEEARSIMCRQREMLANMKDVIGTLKTEALGDKTKVIKLQGELLERKEEQLASLQTAVRTTVQDSVKTEIRTYSDALKKPTAAAPISPAAFKKVVKDVFEDEDRSKNIMVFGLAEEDGEQLEDTIISVFSELGEKPKCPAVRVGKSPVAGIGCRPVKVTLASSTAVRQLLMKARLLRQVERLKSVYLCPDRSPEERASRRQLILDLKKKTSEQPEHRHYIKCGKVVSEPKT